MYKRAALILTLVLHLVVVKIVIAKDIDNTFKEGVYTVNIKGPEYADSVVATIFDSQGKEVAILNGLSLAVYPNLEIRGEEAFWIFGSEYASQSELRITSFKNKETITIYKGKRLNFSVSHNANLIAVTFDPTVPYRHNIGFANGIILLNKVGGNKQTLLEPDESGYVLIEWSGDDSKFWIGHGIIGGWGSLGVYQNGKVKWFDIRSSEDTIIEYDRGWVTFSDVPAIYDNISREEFIKSKVKTTLWLYDVFNKKQVEIATGVANSFNPKWQAGAKNPKLIYYVAGKEFVVDPVRLFRDKKNLWESGEQKR